MLRIRLNLTSKMMLFAAVIAVLPLLVAGQSLIRVTRDELKSAANDQIAGAARKLPASSTTSSNIRCSPRST